MNRRSQPARLLEDTYPFVHELRSQFRDMDPLGHVNNVVLGAYYEDARVHFLRSRWGGGRRAAGEPYLMVANSDIDYLGEVVHPRVYRIGCGVSRIGTSSLVVSQAIFLDGRCLGLADVTVVNMLDDRPAPLAGPRRDALIDYEIAFEPAPAG